MNEIRRSQFAFTLEVTKCAGSQAILHLGVAFGNFLGDLKKPKGVRKARYPRFKNKGLHDSFSLWNDQFAIDGTRIREGRIPHGTCCQERAIARER